MGFRKGSERLPWWDLALWAFIGMVAAVGMALATHERLTRHAETKPDPVPADTAARVRPTGMVHVIVQPLGDDSVAVVVGFISDNPQAGITHTGKLVLGHGDQKVLTVNGRIVGAVSVVVRGGATRSAPARNAGAGQTTQHVGGL